MIDKFYNGYILPFRDLHFVIFLFASFISVCGTSMMQMAYMFELGGLSALQALQFYLAQFGILGFFVMPLAFILYRKINVLTWHGMIVLLTLIPALLLPVFQGNYFATGTLLSLSVSGFWILFHIYLTENASNTNKGNEISLTLNAVALGSLTGIGFATLFTLLEVSAFSMGIAGCLLGFAGVLTFAYFNYRLCRMRPKEPVETATLFEVLREKPTRSFNTFFSGIMEIPTFVLFPLWLLLSGIGVLSVGLVSIFTMVLKVAISAFAGHLSNQKSDRGISIGNGIVGAGWLPWFIVPTLVSVPVATIIWSIGMHIRKVSSAGQWYERKSLHLLAAMAICICTGRMVGFAITIPVIYFYTQEFIILGLGVSFCVFLLSVFLTYKDKTQAQKH